MSRRDFLRSLGLASALLCARFRAAPERPPASAAEGLVERAYVYRYCRCPSDWFVCETASDTPPYPDGFDGHRLVSVEAIERRPRPA